MKNVKRFLAMAMALCLVIGLLPMSILALTAQPSDGETTLQPFASGTQGSQYFRIPALITTNSGRLVAAADARWDGTGDAGGIDTLVAYSDDNGATWKNTFANYLGDNDKAFNTDCATFIDPALAYDPVKDVVYLMTTFYPGGYAINTADNTPVAEDAFVSVNGTRYLKIKATGATSYDYYLNGTQICSVSNNTPVADYTVDGKFNVYDANNNMVGNLFFNDSTTPYTVVPTTYLYMTSSTDEGEHWSDPILVDAKKSDEYFYGVGPGRGYYADGVIFFNCYVYDGTDNQRASVIYSADGGKTWTRTADIPADVAGYSGESQLVQLADGTYRVFFRNGKNYICYADTADGTSWTVTKTSTANNSSCQISAIMYPELINGKQAILLSCPTSSQWSLSGTKRTAGKIFVALVNEDKTLDFTTFSAIAVSDNEYQYSCMTILDNGDVGILYENGDASILFNTYAKESIFPGAKIGDDVGFVDTDNTTFISSVTLGVHDPNATYAFVGLESNQVLTITSAPDSSVANAVISGAGIIIDPVGVGKTSVTVTVQQSSRAASVGDTHVLTITVEDDYSGTPTQATTGEPTYVLDTDGIDSNAQYVIVCDGNALTNVGGAQTTGETSVTIEDNAITNLDEDSDDYVLWTFTGSGTSFTIKNTDSYLYPSGSSTLQGGPSACTLSASNGSYTITGNNVSLAFLNGFRTTQKTGLESIFGGPSACSVSLYKKTTASSGWVTDLSKLNEWISIGENDYPKANTDGKYTAESWAAFMAALEAANARKNAEYDTDGNQKTYTTEADAKNAQGTGENGRVSGTIDYATETLAKAIAGLTLAPRTVNLTMTVGDSYTAEASGTEITGNAYVDAAINAGKITITATNVGTTTLVDNVVTYNITVNPQVKDISINVDGIYKDTVTGTTATVEDETIAKAEIADGTLSITGLAVGNTKVDTGNVVYNVTVTEFATGDDTPVLSGQTGTQAEGKVVTKLIISEGLSYQLVVPDEYKNETITWKTGSTITIVDADGNTEVVTNDKLTVDANGKVTAADNFLDIYEYAETTLTVTIDGLGSYTIPVVVKDLSGDTESVTLYDIYINEVVDTDVYYVWNCDPDPTHIYQAQEGEVIYVQAAAGSSDSSALDFFGAPYDGYALTRMAATNSDGAYFLLHNGETAVADRTINTGSTGFLNGTVTIDGNAYNGAGINQKGVFNANNNSTDDLIEMLENVIAKDCDGGLGFTRLNGNTNKVSSSLDFGSQRLPTIDKSIVGVLGSSGKQADWNTYTDGMYATVGEYIFFQIDVQKYAEASGESIDYTPNTGDTVILADVLPGSFFTDGKWSYDYNTNTITINKLAEAQQASDGTYYIDLTNTFDEAGSDAWSNTYYVVYEIQAGDVNSTITNTATLTYKYKAQYSSGALSDSADAAASMHILGTSLGDLVIDFGLPVTIDGLTSAHYADKFDMDKTNAAVGGAKYGQVTMTKNDDGTYSVTYTPDGILQGYDVVYLLKSDGNLVNYFRVYPSTTVNYEEGFIDWDANWSDASKGSGNQEYAELGQITDANSKGANNYGYDENVANSTTNTVATTTVGGASGSFTFTGTGFDLYAKTTTTSGYVSVKVVNANNKVVKLFTVNTVSANGTTNATSGQATDLCGLPIVSLNGLDHGTYTVTVTKIMDNTKNVYIDGVRIYGTIKEDITYDENGNITNNNSIYKSDLEDNPSFYELRDYVLSAIGITDETSKEYGSVANLAGQIYQNIGTASVFATVLDDNSYEDINVQDLLDNGPKNELFLYPGQSLTFKVKTDRLMQLGLKAPNGDTTYTIKGTTTNVISGTISSSVDMFYSLGNERGTETTYTVTITNEGENILSVTDLKICDDPNVSFVPLTVEDIEMALNAMGYQDESYQDETEPEATEPEATEPEATEPEATEPEATEPEATEPETTEPEATEPEATEPEAPEPEKDNPFSFFKAIGRMIRKLWEKWLP